MVVKALIGVCGLLHVGFMVLEMSLWTKPVGLRIFRQSKEKADASAVLAANQGLYNGILAVGLFWSIFIQPPEWAGQMQVFFLGAVIVAGIYGALTVSRGIFWLQAFPAILGMAAIFATI